MNKSSVRFRCVALCGALSVVGAGTLLSACAGGAGAPAGQAARSSADAGTMQPRAARAPQPADAFDTAMDAPPTPETLFRLSRILAAQGRDAECRHVLQDLIDRYPNFAPAYCDLAEVHMRAGRTDQASEVLEQGLKQVPKDARLIGNLGMAYMVKGDYPRALDKFAQAAAIGSDDARHRANMAAALGMMGRYDECLAEYEKVVAPAAAHYNMAVLARARHDKDRAETELALAVQLDPRLDQDQVSAAASTKH